MTEKLTLEDCFKYYKATIIYEQEKFFGIGDFFRCSNPTLNISDCKLILRSIEQLTDGEKEYISKFLSITYREVEKYLNEQEMLNYTFKESLHIADYLRKKNIMIENPNWFEIGKAVKE